VLRNVSAGALQDREDAWGNLDGRLDLVGFRYERLGGLQGEASGTLAGRPVEWLKAWLGKQTNPENAYLPQPFQQLAESLRQHGFPEKANAVMIAAINHRRDAATTPLTTRALLWGGWATIGYGYENWRSLIWLTALVAFGTWAAGRGKGVLGRATLGQRFWYSVDQLIPLLELNRRHKSFNPTGWVRGYFYLHHIFGFILASLLVAGLTGLTR